MKKRINLRLILIAGIAVIVTMVCMTGIYYKLFQGQVRKDLQVNARLLSDTGLFDDPDNTNVSLSEYYEVGEDLRVTWIAKDGTVLFDNDLDISQLPNHKNRPEVKTALFQGEGESVRRSDTMQMDNYYLGGGWKKGAVCVGAHPRAGCPGGFPCGIPICDADTDTDCFHLYCSGTFFNQTIAASD